MKPDNTHIDSILSAFEKTKILVIGDAMLDIYTHGVVNRTSPEAPVPVVEVTQRNARIGGAANVAGNIKALGATPILCSIIGNDMAGNNILELLQKQNITTDNIIVSKQRPTTTKERVICNGRHMIRIDEETKADINADELEAVKQRIHNILNNDNINGIVIQDYDKGLINKDLIQYITALSNSKGIPVTVDPKKKHFCDYDNVTLFKPNAKELYEGMGMTNNDINAIAEVSKKLCTAKKHRYVMTTLSERGVLITDGDKVVHLEAIPRNIKDVSGAGDTVISTAVLCLATNQDMRTTAFMANIAGGLVCEQEGVVSIDKQRLAEETKRLIGTL